MTESRIAGPVRIVGRLDVGKKTDEMGLVSFVRIYDAAITRSPLGRDTHIVLKSPWLA